MNLTSNAKKVSLLAASIALAGASATSQAYPLYSENGSELNLDIEAVRSEEHTSELQSR